jgi:glutamyl-Q tRNA(Asp) synthetase
MSDRAVNSCVARHYRGRFAPSPTGKLHFGSLVAAVASYLDARAHRGQWLVRMEDVDETRCVAGAADSILRTLEAFGFAWDENVMVQSRRKNLYADVIAELQQQGAAYPCGCSRAEIESHGKRGAEGFLYPGTCRNGLRPGTPARSIRVRTSDREIAFRDRIHGPQAQNVGKVIGDFVVRRADGFAAYQLAVVIDDAEQGISHVVRGADLLLSTPRQLHLFDLMGLRGPTYAHVPLVVDGGAKLSKHNQAPPIQVDRALEHLRAALIALGQIAPHDPTPDRLDDFWPWAIDLWNIETIGTANVAIDTLR